MRSIAGQTVAEMGGAGSVLARQQRDHIELDQLLHELRQSASSEQDETLRKIYRLAFPHAFAEETVLWPLMRRVLPDGEGLTLEVELEHQEINELATRLETLEPGSETRQQVLGRLIELFQEDVRDEEDKLLPRLQAKLTDRQLRRLGLAWEAVRLIAPTRPHPIVSRRPPGNVLSALPLANLDRCRDGVDVLLDRSPSAAASPVRSLSSTLAAASRAVERLPGMRQGEDEATRVGPNRRLGWGAVALGAVAASALILWTRRRR